MILTRKYTFQAARKLTKINPDHICANLHGHTFQVTIKIEGQLNKENDFVMDFFDIDKIFNRSVFDRLDHKCLNEIDGLENPTSENIACWIWQRLKPKLPELFSIEVKETCTSGCIYTGDN